MPTVTVSHASRRLLELAHLCMSRALQLDYLSDGSGHNQTTPLRSLRTGHAPARPTRSGGRRDIIRQYLLEVATRGRLTSTEEYCLAKRALAGNQQARGRLIEHHLGLVVMIARPYRNRGLPLLDLIAEGNVGLLKALEKFDPERGYRLSTYAKWWIRQQIELALMTQAGTVHVPVHVTRTLRRQSRGNIPSADGPTTSTVAQEQEPFPGLDRLLLHDVRQSEAGYGTAADEVQALVERIAAPEHEQPDWRLHVASRREHLTTVLRRLRDVERLVLESRFGLTDGIDRTLQSIAKELHLSSERVRQIQGEALNKLRLMLQTEGDLGC
jgi:RNA polymerase sigma factor (sigma-70 family)